MPEILPKFMPEKYRYLKSKRAVDLLELDEELREIPVLVQDASEIAAQANEIKLAAKDNLSVVSATVADNLRRIPLITGKTRSEQQVDSEIALDARYQAALTENSEARLDSGLWESLADGLQKKMEAIRISGQLIANGFLTSNYILDKRRSEIRAVVPQPRGITT